MPKLLEAESEQKSVVDQELGVQRCVIPILRLMDKSLHDPKDPKLWELWYIPYNG